MLRLEDLVALSPHAWDVLLRTLVFVVLGGLLGLFAVAFWEAQVRAVAQWLRTTLVAAYARCPKWRRAQAEAPDEPDEPGDGDVPEDGDEKPPAAPAVAPTAKAPATEDEPTWVRPALVRPYVIWPRIVVQYSDPMLPVPADLAETVAQECTPLAEQVDDAHLGMLAALDRKDRPDWQWDTDAYQTLVPNQAGAAA